GSVLEARSKDPRTHFEQLRGRAEAHDLERIALDEAREAVLSPATNREGACEAPTERDLADARSRIVRQRQVRSERPRRRRDEDRDGVAGLAARKLRGEVGTRQTFDRARTLGQTDASAAHVGPGRADDTENTD